MTDDKRIQRWADQAMFKAEPMTADRPTVHLLWMTPDPLGALAAAASMYEGRVVRSLAEVTDEDRLRFFNDMTKTTLNAAFETIEFQFLIDGVTRAFTHQLVRQRTAVYFQESMRFAVIDENFSDRVTLPPSLKGTTGEGRKADEALVAGRISAAEHSHTVKYMSDKERQRQDWDNAVTQIERAYTSLVNSGVPAEDARGLLPTNIKTRIIYKTNLRNLVGHAGLRLCTQAQFEWRYVFSEIARAIREAKVAIPLPAGDVTVTHAGEAITMGTDDQSVRIKVHMSDLIADKLFRPICYQTGKCEFMASFDRACSIRDRVQANHAHGRDSSQWHLQDPIVPELEAINPAEWLMDPGAARR